MPTLEKFREDYYTHSGKVSDIARTLALSAIAIVWVFKGDGDSLGVMVFPEALLQVARWAIFALGFDLLQYAWASLIWGAWSRWKEFRGAKQNEELLAPSWFNWPSLFFFWVKLVAVGTAYFTLLAYLNERIQAV